MIYADQTSEKKSRIKNYRIKQYEFSEHFFFLVRMIIVLNAFAFLVAHYI